MQRFKIIVKKREESFTGTGDILAALILAWSAKTLSLSEACHRSVCSLQDILRYTVEHPRAGGVKIKTLELNLVPASGFITTPVKNDEIPLKTWEADID